MTNRKQVVTRTVALLTLSFALHVSCTDVGLYQWKHDPFQANKLTVSGTVCTDDPRQRDFPVKILFVVDTSHPTQLTERVSAVRELVEKYNGRPNYYFGAIAFGGGVFRFEDQPAFMQDFSVISNVIPATVAYPMGCQAGRCRDMLGAITTATSLVTDDILAGDPGEVARTSYVIVLFAQGPPTPPISRCLCRNPTTEEEATHWDGCPWEDDCEADIVAGVPPSCTEAQSGNPVDPWDVYPHAAVTACPDTFSHWVLPADITADNLEQNHNLVRPESGFACSPCSLCCVYPYGGRPDSCEERQLVSKIRALRSFALANGVAQLQFHSTYLPDLTVHPPGSQFAPWACDCGGTDCSAQADRARTVRLLSEMAFAGGGSFKQFFDESTGQFTPLSFRHVDFFNSREPLVIKELVVSNANVLPTDRGLQVDSDQDGLDDETEKQLALCHLDPDTDGDGVNDAIEIKLARDPLIATDPVECLDLDSDVRQDTDLCGAGATKEWKTYEDRDGDTLNACEERLLGTDDSLFDSDADGIPDKLEFVFGTNFLAVDVLDDPDFDGALNRDEVRGHTDPRANDAQEQLDLSYRYEEVDEGLQLVISFSQPPTITGVSIRNASSTSELGVGFLKFEPADPTLGGAPSLAWSDPGDVFPNGGANYGPAVDVSVARQEGYQLHSAREDRFITVFVEGPTQYLPKLAIDQIVISGASRNCLRFRVRNITLKQTEAAWTMTPNGMLPGSAGDNNVFIYFAETPKDAKDGYGIFRVATQLLNYQLGPPETRTPKTAEVTFSDDNFVIFE